MTVLDQFRIDGKRALITGGSRGLGRAMAQALAEAGADLVLAARDLDSLGRASKELAVTGRRIDCVVADLATGAAAEQFCDTVLSKHPPIDVLINNVGGRRDDIATEDMPLETWQRLMDLNLTSVLVCTKRIGGAMLERGWGRVINVASICARIAGRGIRGRHYETAKAAVVGLTRAVAADWASTGVTVNAISPGGFMTDANRRWFRERPEFQKQFEDQVPMGRLGDPAEIGPLALYLASDASRYMTGADLVIDGGYTLW